MVEKQVDTTLVRIEAYNIVRKHYGSQFAAQATHVAFMQGGSGWGRGRRGRRKTSAYPRA